jgi:hypothetical protein
VLNCSKLITGNWVKECLIRALINRQLAGDADILVSLDLKAGGWFDIIVHVENAFLSMK